MIGSRVHHIAYAVRDLATARRFYEDVLGLETVERPDFGLPGVWYAAGDAQLHLIQTPEGVDVGAAPPSLTPLANHNAFAIDDYAAALAHFRRHGVDVLETNPELGQMWVRDPDGHVLEFTTDR
jgi:catechol 2,3-dioxygenase-like lactoylglutathione lyase family enzyme